MKIPSIILLFFCFLSGTIPAQQVIKGIILEQDSITPLPFVYIINKSNGNGTMSDNDGHFVLTTSSKDTLICSYVGYLKLKIPVEKLAKDVNGNVRVIMAQIAISLNEVNITTFKFQAYERQYMNDIIDRSRIKNISYATSPISALYMRYSKEGKQIQKLAKIFEDVLMEEEVQRKLSREILVRLTGDENIDYYAFRRYCYYVNDYYIVSHEGFDLYSKVMECYKNWTADNGGYRKKESTEIKQTNPNPDAMWKKREPVKDE